MADILYFFKSPGTLSGTNYDDEVVAMMGRAFELVRSNIALRGCAAVSDEAIAKQIIELTTEGERSATKLTAKVIACFDAENVSRRSSEYFRRQDQRSGRRYTAGRETKIIKSMYWR
jgi:hypothetical protein